MTIQDCLALGMSVAGLFLVGWGLYSVWKDREVIKAIDDYLERFK